MRINKPVTNREYNFDDSSTLLSTTDSQSNIVYANPAFIQTSGFELAELTSQPHNIVRHPDMPKEAFADMWRTLKTGKAWTALVKNRRKNGDHYWVRANATPMARGGKVTGYMSVRTKPSRDEINLAENLYAKFREGKAKGLVFYQGIVVRSGIQRVFSLLQIMPVQWRIRLAMAAAPLATLAACSMAGLAAAPIIPLAGATIVTALLACLWLERQVSKPLQIIAQQAQNVASGSPGENIHFNRVDEIGLLLRSINQAGLNLRALVDDVDAQVEGITTATQQIAEGNNDLSARTEQSASSLQETAAAMEQLTVTIANNADSANKVSELATQTSDAAARGGEVVSRVVSTMQEITDSSGKIADIIGVIDAIAFQTNILALNASVEAARAGEQGRGFAVVASEVRNLAGRSADAAKEIKQLIGTSAERVEAGSALAQQAGAAMENIVSQVRQVTVLIGEISLSSQEQSNGAAQVGEAVIQLEQATQQNAALVVESAAAADSLMQQVSRLSEALAVYRTSNGR